MKSATEDENEELRSALEESASVTPAEEDFYYEGPYVVFTSAYHLKRGFCCNSDCRHCPYKESTPGDTELNGS
jgi:hypothetical protein